ncbi:MAG: hypothetical protein Q8R91_01240 [Candidatus Omnitrophota bacterium]|nr:hypothetical protein [Candidatus Omnitrophota bacterium]
MTPTSKAGRAPHVICAVEDGWRGMRLFSLEAIKRGAHVAVLIRGSVDPQLLGLITVPEGMTLTALAFGGYRFRVALRLLRGAFHQVPKAFVVDKPRTKALLGPLARALGFRTHRLIETPDGFHFDAAAPAFLGASVKRAGSGMSVCESH